MVTIIVILCAAVVGIASIYFLGPNNPVEKAAEEVVEDELPNIKPANPTTPKAS